MNCEKIIDTVYNSEGSLPFYIQIQKDLHTFFCSECAQKIENYESARNILNNDFFPVPPVSLENSIMTKIQIEDPSYDAEESFAMQGGFSLRSWVIAGIILAVSLVIAFFSLDYQHLSEKIGISFILPMGITIGIILTTYGVILIGSHLKELSVFFGINNENTLNEELRV